MRRAEKLGPPIIWYEIKPRESRGPSSIIVEPSFLQGLRHLEMMLQRGQRLAGPILQVGIVATL